MALKVKMDILDRLKKLLLGEDFKCFVPRYGHGRRANRSIDRPTG